MSKIILYAVLETGIPFGANNDKHVRIAECGEIRLLITRLSNVRNYPGLKFKIYTIYVKSQYGITKHYTHGNLF